MDGHLIQQRIKASEGHYLTQNNDSIVNRCIATEVIDIYPQNWKEITAEEAEKLRKEIKEYEKRNAKL